LIEWLLFGVLSNEPPVPDLVMALPWTVLSLFLARLRELLLFKLLDLASLLLLVSLVFFKCSMDFVVDLAGLVGMMRVLSVDLIRAEVPLS
jgi:hypothetical protein